MQHTLLVMRHGKAQTNKPTQTDFDRILAPQGEKEVASMASAINRLFIPTTLLCSSALRTKQTAEIVCVQNRWNPDIINYIDELYLASPKTILSLLGGLNNENTHVMLIGHNPGLTEIIQFLPNVNIDHLPTAGYASIELPNNDWQNIAQNIQKSTLTAFNYPK